MLPLFAADVRLQAFVEIARTHTGINDGRHDQNNSEGGESRQLLLSWFICMLTCFGVYSDNLKEKIGQAAKVKNLGEKI